MIYSLDPSETLMKAIKSVYTNDDFKIPSMKAAVEAVEVASSLANWTTREPSKFSDFDFADELLKN